MATTNKTYYSVTETAVLLRAALKQAFPGVTFSVKSKSYSGGASINVSWTDGPTGEQVETVTSVYQGATFDGSIDLKSYVTAIVMTTDGPREVHYGADYIFANRKMSAAMLGRVYGFLCRKYGITPRAQAVRETSWGAELTNEAALDRISPESWCRDQVRDLLHREGSKMTVVNGCLIVPKG